MNINYLISHRAFKCKISVIFLLTVVCAFAVNGCSPNEELLKKPSAAPGVPIGSADITRMYAHTAQRLEGLAASLDQLPKSMVVRWVGKGSITWQVNTPEPGDYEVSLCYAALQEGAQFEIVSGDSRINGTVHKTAGPYEDRRISERGPSYTDYLRNFEKVPLSGVLHIPAGINEITILVTEPESGEVMDFRSMELIPVAAKQSIAEAEERARKSQASTDWFVEAKYGVMFHWTDSSEPRHGPKKTYPEAVRDFDVGKFADMVEDTGAGFVFFTLNHAHPHCPAPISSWEKVHPGWTTERDLVSDIADALNKKGIKLILYIASHILLKSELIPEEQGVEVHMDILRELGERYGRNLAGYWFDGWDIIPQRFPNAPVSFERFFKAAKSGNPDRIIGLNFWIFPDATLWQEYWAGEADEELKPAAGRYIEYDAGKGLQRHALFMLEDIWVHRKPDSGMEKPVFTEKELISYVKQLAANDGVATINLGIYQDGTIGNESRKLMQSLRQAIRR